MAKRGKPGALRSSTPSPMPHQAEHDKMMSSITSTLSAIGDTIRKPFTRPKDKIPKAPK